MRKDSRLANEQGITIVALVVIIIVLLILAGVTLGLTLGQNGIIERAETTGDTATIQQEQEKLSTLALTLASKQMMTGDEVLLSELAQALEQYIGDSTDINNTDGWLSSVEIEEASGYIKVITNQKNIFLLYLDEESGNPNVSFDGKDDGTQAPVIALAEVEYNQEQKNATIHVKASTQDDRGIIKVEVEKLETREKEKEKETDDTFTITRNGSYIIKVTGGNGKTAWQKVVVDQIKNVGNIQMTANITSPINAIQNGPVVVTIQWEEVEGYRKQYKVGSTTSSWTDVTDTTKEISVTQNTVIYARYFNGVQGDNEQTFIVGNIDNIAPNAFDLKTQTTLNSITVTANTTDGAGAGASSGTAGIKGYYFTIDGGANWVSNKEPSNGTYTFNDLKSNTTYTLQGKAVDLAGNERLTMEKQITTTKLPGGEDITFNISPETWVKDSVTVSVNYPEVENTIKQYSLDGIKWNTYNGPFEVSENGNVYARLEDTKGGLGDTAAKEITNIDKIYPSIALSQPETWGKDSITVSAVITDGESGVAEQKYMQGKKQIADFANAGTEFSGNTFEATANGEWTVYAKDNVGNENVQVINVTQIDKTPPSIQSMEQLTPTNGNVLVAAIITDNESGVAEQKYMQGNKTVADFANAGTTITDMAFEATENGEWTIYAKDNVGNEVVSVIQVTKQDKIAPTITKVEVISPSSGYYKAGTQVTIRVTYNEKVKGTPAKLKLLYGNGSQHTVSATISELTNTIDYVSTINEGDNGLLAVTALEGDGLTDEAGNMADQTLRALEGPAIQADTIAPTGEVSGNPTNWINTNATLTCKGTDDGSGVKRIKFSDSEVWSNASSALGIVMQNGNYTFTIEDNAGNVTTIPVNVTMIDKTNPNTTAPVVTQAGSNVAKIENKQTDDGSGIGAIEYGYKKKTDTTWNWQTSDTVAEVAVGIEYEYKTRVRDNVGNPSATGWIESEVTAFTIGIDQTVLKDYSGNGYDATIHGAQIVFDDEGQYTLRFDGVDDYVQIPTISGNFNYSEGITINAVVEYEAFNHNSMILMLGNGYDTSSGDGKESIVLQSPGTDGKLGIHAWTSARSSVDNRNNQISSETTDSVIPLNQKINIHASVEKYIVTYFQGKISVDGQNKDVTNSTVSSVIFGIDEVDRTENYIGRSSWPSDGYFKGKLYSLELLDADGKQIFYYDLSRTGKAIEAELNN